MDKTRDEELHNSDVPEINRAIKITEHEKGRQRSTHVEKS
jgi:hypothetical protein